MRGQDTDRSEVGECARDGSVVVFEGLVCGCGGLGGSRNRAEQMKR